MENARVTGIVAGGDLHVKRESEFIWHGTERVPK